MAQQPQSHHAGIPKDDKVFPPAWKLDYSQTYSNAPQQQQHADLQDYYDPGGFRVRQHGPPSYIQQHQQHPHYQQMPTQPPAPLPQANSTTTAAAAAVAAQYYYPQAAAAYSHAYMPQQQQQQQQQPSMLDTTQQQAHPHANMAGLAAASSRPVRKRRRPPHSYASLIAQAILTSPEQRLTLREIYEWIQTRYPNLYEANETGWQVSQDNNLHALSITFTC